MEQHAVPRQITSFEFKLIGFLTLRQFGLVAIFTALTVIVFYIIPVPLLNVVLAAVTALAGIFIVFIPINDRPVDTWVRNFLKKLFSPSQYTYIKKNAPPHFLHDVFVPSHPDVVQAHVDAQNKLSSYLGKTTPPQSANPKKNVIQDLIHAAPSQSKPQPATTPPPSAPVAPFLYGVVKNNKDLPLPNMLIYIKDESGKPLRILKSNHNGVFATFHALAPNTYNFEIKDMSQKHFFDTMRYTIAEKNDKPLNFFSKELL